MSNTNSDVVRGLREAADFLEQHPELPAALWASVHLRYPAVNKDNARATLATVANALGGRAEEQTYAGSVTIQGKFSGDVSVKATAKVSELVDAPPEPSYEPIIAQADVPVTLEEDEAWRDLEARR